ncbi:MAG TPA: VWA domain-containing protein [Terriglobia bacterium]|nr:VWA domain-containing protein [Terriglobia bacterium]
MRFFVTSPVLVLCVVFTLIAAGRKPQNSSPNDFKLSVDVDLVVFNVTVTDSKGHSVTGLSKENFHVIESGQEQAIRFVRHEDTPATVGLVIDNSGSMRRRRSDVIDGAIRFAESSNPQDELFIVNFNERVFMGLPEGTAFTSDVVTLRSALAKTRAEGKTALYDGVSAAVKRLQAGTHQRKALVVLSDGGDNASGASASDVVSLAKESNASIYTIEIDDPDDKDQNPKILEDLSKLTAGESYRVKSPEELAGIWLKIAGGIRDQYTIGYISKNPAHDGAFRNVKVIATDSNGKPLRVRARKGYIAPGSTSELQ